MDSISSDNAVDDFINRLARFAYDRACNRVAVLAQNKDFRAARGPASAEVSQSWTFRPEATVPKFAGSSESGYLPEIG